MAQTMNPPPHPVHRHDAHPCDATLRPATTGRRPGAAACGHGRTAVRGALWTALAINAAMAGVELVAGAHAGSAALWADAIDFAGDAANYALALLALPLSALWRARAAWVKGATMAAFGLAVAALALWRAWHGGNAEPITMGLVGALALLANLTVAALLYAWRDGDANLRSVWLCTRNDAIGNLAVIAAAAGVFGTGRLWPDLAVAGLMAALAIHAGRSVMRQARAEIRWELGTTGRRG